MLCNRGLRAFGDGYVAVLLPVYLLAYGFDPFAIGVISTSTLLGSALLTLGLGLLGHRIRRRPALLGASVLMAGTGAAFAAVQGFWPLMVVAFVGTLNPSGGDVSVFLPLEHTVLAHATLPERRTAVFARYSVVGSVVAALGSLAAGAVDWLGPLLGHRAVLQAMFALYGVIGTVVFLLYRGLPAAIDHGAGARGTPLGRSRRRVLGLALLFSVDSFGGGFVLNSLLALWLFQRFGLEVATAGTVFFVTGLCAAVSQLARRIGLVNTMVFTHLPANVFLVLAAFAPTAAASVAFLVLRSLLSSMDVPARSSYVMAVVEPAERPAAASLSAVPRSLASAISPLFAGAMLGGSAFGWPLVAGGVLKIAYDLLLLRMFSRVRPEEEQRQDRP